MESSSCQKWEQNKELWTKILNGGLVPYLKNLHGHDLKMTKEFVNGWYKGILSAYGAEFRINEPFIVDITGLQIEENENYRERKAMKEALSIFFNKRSERNRVRKMADRDYKRRDLMNLWVEMEEVIMRYITLDGHFDSIFSYHFTILNHFRHDRKISFPFYLFSSLEHSLSNHAKISENPILHEELILLIIEYAKVHEVKTFPIVNNPKTLASPDVHVVSNTEIEEMLGERVMDWHDLHVSDDPDYWPSKKEGPKERGTPT